jgi:glutaredoxin
VLAALAYTSRVNRHRHPWLPALGGLAFGCVAILVAAGCSDWEERLGGVAERARGVADDAERAAKNAGSRLDRATGGAEPEKEDVELDPTEKVTEFVTPPFPVRGNLKGLHLVWFDGEGVHTASSRDGVAEASRGRVRVESLRAAPEAAGEDALVYVADLRMALPDGAYPVQRVKRRVFDRWIAEATGEAERVAKVEDELVRAAKEADAEHDQDKATRRGRGEPVVMYRTSWCGYCKKAAAYLSSKNVAFVEKDIEADRSAEAEMKQKLARANLSTRGVPVLDIGGTMIRGFDKGMIDHALSMRLGIR